jgi:hypothetical protein
MGFIINVFIVAVVLCIKYVISTFNIVSSYGKNILTTKLLNGSIFVLMNENENQKPSKYVIISSDGEVLGEEHNLTDCLY